MQPEDFRFTFCASACTAQGPGRGKAFADERARGVYGTRMQPEPASDERPSPADRNGVDRSQIREMLGLTPEQRLARVQEFVESVLAIRALNEARPIR